MKSIKSTSILVSTAVAVAACVVGPASIANASPHTVSIATSTTSPPEAANSYTDVDAVGFLAAGVGRIADKHPSLVDYLPRGGNSGAVTQEQVAELTALLVEADPEFDANVTRKLQSGDPYEVESALAAYSAAIDQVSTNNRETVAAVGDGRCLVVVVGAILLVAAVAVKVAMYPKTVDGQLATRDLAAAIATEIRP